MRQRRRGSFRNILLAYPQRAAPDAAGGGARKFRLGTYEPPAAATSAFHGTGVVVVSRARQFPRRSFIAEQIFFALGEVLKGRAKDRPARYGSALFSCVPNNAPQTSLRDRLLKNRAPDAPPFTGITPQSRSKPLPDRCRDFYFQLGAHRDMYGDGSAKNLQNLTSLYCIGAIPKRKPGKPNPPQCL